MLSPLALTLSLSLSLSPLPYTGFLTKKGIHYLHPRFKEFDFHAAMTIEGRPDEELPEQTLLSTRIRGLDLSKMASEVDIDQPPPS